MTRTALWLGGAVGAVLLAWIGCGGDTTASGASTGTPQGAGGASNTTGVGAGTVGPGGSAPCGALPDPPGSAMCPAVCTGGCTAENVCVIDCGMPAMCDGATIDCPQDYACKIICNGQDSCDSSTINCPDIYWCSLECGGGNDACGSMSTVNCTDGWCSVECEADACDMMQVQCGAGACSATCTGMPFPILNNCPASCGCTEC